MEYNLDEYQRIGGKVFVTSDGFKYFSNRTNLNCVHLRCVLFKKGCKGTDKLNTDMNLIYPKSEHVYPETRIYGCWSHYTYTGNLETYPKIWIGPKLSKYTRTSYFCKANNCYSFLTCRLNSFNLFLPPNSNFATNREEQTRRFY